MTISPIRSVTAVFVILSCIGCLNDKDARRLDFTISGNANGTIIGPRDPHERVVEFDLNKDSSPDVWNFYVNKKITSKAAEFLVRKEMDINWDGRIDIVRFYDENQVIFKESYDLDFDGKVDQVNYFENNAVVRKERDLNYDGNTDLWVFYEKGQISRKERDTNNDGRVDYWEYWTGNQVDRVGEDLNGDGTVDRWTQNPVTRES